MWGHSHQPILETDAAYPTNFYGATKAMSESLARVHSHQSQLSVICVRLGAVLRDHDPRIRPSGYTQSEYGITKRDLCQLLRGCIQTKQHFAIVHGVSANQPNRLSLATTQQLLGYQPQDDVVGMARKN